MVRQLTNSQTNRPTIQQTTSPGYKRIGTFTKGRAKYAQNKQGIYEHQKQPTKHVPKLFQHPSLGPSWRCPRSDHCRLQSLRSDPFPVQGLGSDPLSSPKARVELLSRPRSQVGPLSLPTFQAGPPSQPRSRVEPFSRPRSRVGSLVASKVPGWIATKNSLENL